jgi:hypothetical protein
VEKYAMHFKELSHRIAKIKEKSVESGAIKLS